MIITHKQTLINLIDFCVNSVEPSEQKTFAETFLGYLPKDGDNKKIKLDQNDLIIIQAKFVNKLNIK